MEEKCSNSDDTHHECQITVIKHSFSKNQMRARKVPLDDIEEPVVQHYITKNDTAAVLDENESPSISKVRDFNERYEDNIESTQNDDAGADTKELCYNLKENREDDDDSGINILEENLEVLCDDESEICTKLEHQDEDDVLIEPIEMPGFHLICDLKDDLDLDFARLFFEIDFQFEIQLLCFQSKQSYDSRAKHNNSPKKSQSNNWSDSKHDYHYSRRSSGKSGKSSSSHSRGSSSPLRNSSHDNFDFSGENEDPSPGKQKENESVEGLTRLPNDQTTKANHGHRKLNKKGHRKLNKIKIAPIETEHRRGNSNSYFEVCIN